VGHNKSNFLHGKNSIMLGIKTMIWKIKSYGEKKKFCLLTLILLNLSILAASRNASTPNADKTRNSFGNADRVLSFYLTAQCRNIEHVSKQSWL